MRAELESQFDRANERLARRTGDEPARATFMGESSRTQVAQPAPDLREALRAGSPARPPAGLGASHAPPVALVGLGAGWRGRTRELHNINVKIQSACAVRGRAERPGSRPAGRLLELERQPLAPRSPRGLARSPPLVILTDFR